MIGRRTVITGLGAAAAWPLAARGQQAGRLPTIGLLGASTPVASSQWTTAFIQRLRELGWAEGHTIAIEYRWAEGRSDRAPEIVAEFVRLKVALIVTHAPANVLAAKGATTEIPIVFASAGDPVGTGLVASLARPGGNVTGMSMQQPELAGKRLELARELVPNLNRLAIMVNLDSAGAVLDMAEVQAAALGLKLQSETLGIRNPDDIAPTLAALKGRADAVYVASDPLTTTNQVRINTLALSARLPTIYGLREYVAAGGLMSYGPNLPSPWRRAADFVDKILRGTKPADIPVEQPTKFDLVINLTTATTLGLTVPPTLLATADEVIE